MTSADRDPDDVALSLAEQQSIMEFQVENLRLQIYDFLSTLHFAKCLIDSFNDRISNQVEQLVSDVGKLTQQNKQAVHKQTIAEAHLNGALKIKETSKKNFSRAEQNCEIHRKAYNNIEDKKPSTAGRVFSGIFSFGLTELFGVWNNISKKHEAMLTAALVALNNSKAETMVARQKLTKSVEDIKAARTTLQQAEVELRNYSSQLENRQQSLKNEAEISFQVKTRLIVLGEVFNIVYVISESLHPSLFYSYKPLLEPAIQLFELLDTLGPCIEFEFLKNSATYTGIEEVPEKIYLNAPKERLLKIIELCVTENEIPYLQQSASLLELENDSVRLQEVLFGWENYAIDDFVIDDYT